VKSVARGVTILAILLVSLGAADVQEADKKTACEHEVQYIQATRKVSREFEASERFQRLLALKRSYTEKIKHAPENARIAAGQWTAALSRAENKIKSDKMEDRAFFDVLKFRKRLLRAFEIKAEAAGF
jgi:hypothetical protein